MKTIVSAHNPALKHLAKLLACAKTRRRHAQAVLEGVHLLESCLNAGKPPQQVYVPQTRLHHREIRALLTRLPPASVCITAEKALTKISSLTEADDITAVISLPESAPLPQTGDCLVLEDIQDPGNVGTMMRSAAAAGIRHILFSKNCADAWSPKVLRAGMGAHFALHLHECADLAHWLNTWRGQSIATALHPDSRPLYTLDLRGDTAWLFGNEGAGLGAALQQQASTRAVIPMAGQTESLNVAAAAAVCLFEQVRQRGEFATH